MSEDARCPLCGALRPAASAGGECPHCQVSTLGEPSAASALALEKTLAMDDPAGGGADATQCADTLGTQPTFATNVLETLAQPASDAGNAPASGLADGPLQPVRPSPTGEAPQVRSASNRYQLQGEIAR